MEAPKNGAVNFAIKEIPHLSVHGVFPLKDL
jgi:hypothetical protein